MCRDVQDTPRRPVTALHEVNHHSHPIMLHVLIPVILHIIFPPVPWCKLRDTRVVGVVKLPACFWNHLSVCHMNQSPDWHQSHPSVSVRHMLILKSTVCHVQKHYPKCKKVWPKVGIAFYSTACNWIPSSFILYNYSEYTTRRASQYCFIAKLFLKTQVLTENSLIEVFQIKSLKLYKVVKISCTSFNYDCKKLLTHEIISDHNPIIHITLSNR